MERSGRRCYGSGERVGSCGGRDGSHGVTGRGADIRAATCADAPLRRGQEIGVCPSGCRRGGGHRAINFAISVEPRVTVVCHRGCGLARDTDGSRAGSVQARALCAPSDTTTSPVTARFVLIAGAPLRLVAAVDQPDARCCVPGESEPGFAPEAQVADPNCAATVVFTPGTHLAHSGERES